jgi:hypothetical protein
MRTKSNRSLSALHCEVTASGMETEPVGRLDSPWPYMTCYDIRNIDAATKQLLEAGNQPAASLFDGILKDSRFDIRTYREVKCWQDEEWDGGKKRTLNYNYNHLHTTPLLPPSLTHI